MNKFQSPVGVKDIFGNEAARLRMLEEKFAGLCQLNGYEQLISPIFEDAGVFARLGEETVSKEMYDFHDRKGRHLALRPELTASAARAFIQHSPTPPWKVWYFGPQFRYEQPQAGRYRQFHQLGVEIFGVEDALSDVEVIALGWKFLQSVGLGEMRLLLNSLGGAESREEYTSELRNYFEGHRTQLSEQSQQTLERNPLRVLDSKRTQDQQVIAEAPSCLDFLTEEAKTRFEAVQAGLDALGIAFEIDPRLVRGLDYYTHTAFEYVSDTLAGTQSALGGGGRYDGLVEALGGKPTSGIGFALGADRILLDCETQGVFASPDLAVDVFVIDVCDGMPALMIGDELFSAGVSSDRAYGGRSMKAQMKAADRSGARFALIIGEDEQSRGVVSVRDLEASEQTEMPRDEVVAHILARLKDS